MDVVIQYRLSDGLILGAWQAATDALLHAQVAAPDGTDASVVLETDVPFFALATDYYIQGGALQPKTALTLTATPNPFVANGVAHSSVTVAPFQPCTLVVDGTSHALVVGDAVLTLTANAPHVFHVSLAPMAPAMAEPITVEAR